MKRVSRRSFLEKSSLVLASAAAVSAIPATVQAAQAPSMFVHHVYFWLKNPSSKQDHAKLLKGLQTLTAIETIKTSHIGVPADTNRPVIEKSYQFSLLLMFNNRSDQDVYQNHPVHLKFVEDCSSLWTKVIVYDSVNA
jgi:hypothetical protein